MGKLRKSRLVPDGAGRSIVLRSRIRGRNFQQQRRDRRRREEIGPAAPSGRTASRPVRQTAQRSRENWRQALARNIRTENPSIAAGRRSAQTTAKKFFVKFGKYAFTVEETLNKRWTRFRASRRMFRVGLIDETDSSDDSDEQAHTYLLQTVLMNAALYKLLEQVLNRLRARHRRAKRPDTALVQISLSAEGLDFPININTARLFDNSVIDELLGRVDVVLQSHQEIDIRKGFSVDISIVDLESRPELFWIAGSRRKVTRKPKANRGAGLWELAKPQGWSKSTLSRESGVFVLPLMNRDSMFANTCLLAGIVLSMTANSFYRATFLEEDTSQHAYRHLVRMNNDIVGGKTPRTSQYVKKAMRVLREKMVETVESFSLDLEVFRHCELDQALREQVDKLNINLIISKDSSNFYPIFQHPPNYDVCRQRVRIVLVKLGPRNVYHTVSMTRQLRASSIVASETLRYSCIYCKKDFCSEYVECHKCTNSPPRCRLCHRVKASRGEVYIDSEIKKTLCMAEQDVSLHCSRCKQTFTNKSCMTKHNKFCQRDFIACSECGKAYKNTRKHACNEMFCKICREYFVDSEMPESKNGHMCSVKSPKPPKQFERMAFFDYETFTDKDEKAMHCVNAVGLSFEDREKPGLFHEIYFYDDDLAHEESGKLKESAFYQQYWSEKQNVESRQWRCRVRKVTLNNKSGGAEERGDDEDEQDEIDRVLSLEESSADDTVRITAADYIFDEAAEDVASEDDYDDNDDESDDGGGWLDQGEEEQCFVERCVRICGIERPMEHAVFRASNFYVFPFLSSHSDGRKGSTAMDKFLNYILSSQFENYVFAAHNSSKFDALLTLERLMSRGIYIKPVFEGHKLLQMRLPKHKIRFIDTFRYIKSALDKFPSRFKGLKVTSSEEGEEEQNGNNEKGMFPYRMNHPDFYSYNGALPGKHMFVDTFSSEAVEKKYDEMAKAWPPDKTWNMKHELHTYLVQDIRVLRGGCLQFVKELFEFQAELIDEKVQKRREGKRVWGGDDWDAFFSPFTHPYFTISSFFHALFHAYGIGKNRICLLSDQQGARQSSKLEQEWISYQQAKRPHLDIRAAHTHAYGQKFYRGRYYPDGHCVEKTSCGDIEWIFEFLGCRVHMHCQDKQSHCPITHRLASNDKNPFGVPAYVCFKSWERKKAFYESDPNVRLVYVWECEYLKLKNEKDPFLLQVLEHLRLPPRPLATRDSLRGGRTEAQRLYFNEESLADYELHYVDRNSLYPSVAMTYEYPVGEPEILKGRALDEKVTCSPSGFFVEGEKRLGIVQARVLPPDSMFYPILPYKVRGKMFFGLCLTCMEEGDALSFKFCAHSDDKRAMTSVWTTFELEFAMTWGYKILDIHEFYSYPESAPVFRRFYLRLAQMKLGAEQWPEECCTEEQKQKYVDELNSDMPGLNLDVENVAPNDAKRQFAKLAMNCSLGKWSQSEMRTSVRYIYDYEEFLRAQHRDPKITVKSLTVLTNNIAEMTYDPNPAFLGFQRKCNAVIYAMVTARARCEMAQATQKMLKKNCLIFYGDTDSQFVAVPKTADMEAFKREFKIGSRAFSGFKFETETPLREFCCLGSKNYSYCTKDGSSCVKSRGFTLKSKKAKQELNHDTVRELLQLFLNREEKTVTSESFRMKINRQTATVHNATMIKKYSNFLYDKRMLVEEDKITAVTLPFGLKHCQFADCDERVQLKGLSLLSSKNT